MSDDNNIVWLYERARAAATDQEKDKKKTTGGIKVVIGCAITLSVLLCVNAYLLGRYMHLERVITYVYARQEAALSLADDATRQAAQQGGARQMGL